jgi:LacI family transcriptional regulator
MRQVIRPKNNREDVTLKDIAEAVGKSVAAVSRALNNYDDISPDTREYIKRVAREMGYAPTNTLGFILPPVSPRISAPYLSELLTSITEEAARHGFDLLVSTCAADGHEENWAYLRLINSRRVDGIIIARPRSRDPRIELLLEKQFPFVVIGAANLEGDYLTVAEDEHLGARLAVDHLVSQGHQKIALVNTPAELYFSLNFQAGFVEAMQQAGWPVEDEYIAAVDGFNQKSGYQIAQTMLSKTEPPTAFVVADDMVALGVMAAVQDQGLEIGSDVVITGYGDILLSEYAQPPLTTVHRSVQLLGHKASQMIIARLRGEPLAETRLLFQPSLVIRQSSDLGLWL